jgi:hypothetical protein
MLFVIWVLFYTPSDSQYRPTGILLENIRPTGIKCSILFTVVKTEQTEGTTKKYVANEKIWLFI